MSIAPTQDLSYMPDAALRQALQMAQRSNDTMKFLSIKAELDKRSQSRVAAQGQQAGQQMASQGPQTIADKVASGVANLPIHNPGYANGGIVAFSEGGPSWLDRLGESLSALSGNWERPSQKGTKLQAARDAEDDAKLKALLAAQAPASTTPNTVGLPLGQYLSDLVSGNALTVPKMPVADDQKTAASGSGRVAAQRASAPAGIAGLQAPTWQEGDKFTPRSAAEQLAAANAAAAKDNEELAAAYAPMRDKLAAKRAALADQTAESEGILGLKWGNDKRKALRDIGIALLGSKEANFGTALGGALQKGAEGYESAKAAREARADKLDEAENQMRLAEIDRKAGNIDRAEKREQVADHLKATVYATDASVLAHKNTFGLGAYQAAEAARHNLASEDVARRNADATSAYQNARLKMLTDKTKDDAKIKQIYADLWNKTASAVEKEMVGKSDMEKHAAITARVRMAAASNPWLMQYAGNIGFTNGATGKTYDLTAD